MIAGVDRSQANLRATGSGLRFFYSKSFLASCLKTEKVPST